MDISAVLTVPPRDLSVPSPTSSDCALYEIKKDRISKVIDPKEAIEGGKYCSKTERSGTIRISMEEARDNRHRLTTVTRVERCDSEKPP